MQTAAAYIRVSTEDQTEYSPDSQRSKLKEYAAAHDLLLPEPFIYLDEGISGRSAEKRPAFLQMIGTAKLRPKSSGQHPLQIHAPQRMRHRCSFHYRTALR